ncbi:energy transducer TonB [Sphingomonas soli]|uniref:energy transducer TonB n=1 Tax=Sphingomonas soli TaxID=266127 RepID=UPI000831D388|nr:energy transducer TonB [Sphingomonas soli]
MLGKIAMLVASVTMPLSAFAEGGQVLKRTGKWIVDADDGACHLYAEFGEGDGASIVRFSRYSLNPNFEFHLFGPQAKTESLERVELDFGLGAATSRTGMGGVAGTTPVLIMNNVRLDGFVPQKPMDSGPEITPADEARLTGVTIRRVRQADLQLEFGSLGKPFEQLRVCMGNLFTRWGYGPQVQMTLSRKVSPKGDPSKWVTDDDYPAEALRKRQMGVVDFRLDIDASGSVTDCAIFKRTDAAELLSKKVCEMLSRRARFNPALDATGAPVRSFFVSRFTWRIPFAGRK